jgi:murein DD-endopeptidase MepM/ murein hydrolase activator NlpD
MKIRISLVFLLIILFLPNSFAVAQDQQPEGLVYIVQEGDNLWSIALRFGVTVDELVAANQITDSSQVVIGARLIIPGFENLGVSGVLNTSEVGYGENLLSLSRRTGVSSEVLGRLNQLVSPAEIYTGMPLILVETETTSNAGERPTLAPGQTMLELAVLRKTSPWNLVNQNSLTSTWNVLPGEILWLANSSVQPGPGGLPDAVGSVSISPLPAVQGQTQVVHLIGETGMNLGGDFDTHPLNFFQSDEENYFALQGVHAMLEPGLYPFIISGTLTTGEQFAFSQSIFVKSGEYTYDPVLTVSPETIDPTVTKPEEAQWFALTAPVTKQKFWSGLFQSPVPPEFTKCYPSYYGNRRAYNGGAYSFFHTGLDFCGNLTTPIYAPAAGTVVFAGPLAVRGNATVIDHGYGIYTAYMHQSEIMVKPGDVVQPGQQIGKVGATGRVTGPHLHWEVWVGGVQVDPLQWLENEYP